MRRRSRTATARWIAWAPGAPPPVACACKTTLDDRVGAVAAGEGARCPGPARTNATPATSTTTATASDRPTTPASRRAGRLAGVASRRSSSGSSGGAGSSSGTGLARLNRSRTSSGISSPLRPWAVSRCHHRLGLPAALPGAAARGEGAPQTRLVWPPAPGPRARAPTRPRRPTTESRGRARSTHEARSPPSRQARRRGDHHSPGAARLSPSDGAARPCAPHFAADSRESAARSRATTAADRSVRRPTAAKPSEKHRRPHHQPWRRRCAGGHTPAQPPRALDKEPQTVHVTPHLVSVHPRRRDYTQRRDAARARGLLMPATSSRSTLVRSDSQMRNREASQARAPLRCRIAEATHDWPTQPVSTPDRRRWSGSRMRMDPIDGSCCGRRIRFFLRTVRWLP